MIEEDKERFCGKPRNLTMSTLKIQKEGISFYSTLEGLQHFAQELKEEG